MRPGVFVPFAIAAVLLAGCTNGTSGSPGDRSSSTDPVTVAPTVSPPTTPSSTAPAPTTVPADVPTTGPNLLRTGERPPVMPALATQQTRDGAVAFARFFIQTIDWAYATTSTTYMRHYYVGACVTCRSIDAAVSREARSGRHFIGDRLSVVDVRNVSQVVPDGPELSLTLTVAVGSVQVVDANGRRIDGQPAMTIHEFATLYWIADRWTVQELRPT